MAPIIVVLLQEDADSPTNLSGSVVMIHGMRHM